MQLGVLLDRPTTDQKTTSIVLSLGKMRLLEEYWDVIMFYFDVQHMIVNPNFAMMDMVSVSGFRGPLIATNLNTANILTNSFGSDKKFFYVWDLEWIDGNKDLEFMSRIYRHPDIQLIARSKEHFDIISKLWKTPAAIIENFNHEQITEVVSR